MLGARIEKWRPLVQSVIDSGSYPFPADFILSIIQYESAGKVGDVNEQSGASGLMQVMPDTLKWFNDDTGNQIPLSALKGASDQDARAQILTGTWVLGRFWKGAANWLRQVNGPQSNIPLEDIARFGSAYYVAGGGRVREMAPNVRPMTWSVWEKRYPKKNITLYANRIWDKAKTLNPDWNLPAIDRWINTKPPKPVVPPVPALPPVPGTVPTPIFPKDATSGMVIGLLILALGYWWMQPKGKPGGASA